MDLPSGIQSSLHPRGPHAEAVADFSWLLFYGGAAVLAVVVAVAAMALWGPARHRRWMAGNRFVLYGGLAFPAVVLTALFVYSLSVIRAVATSPEPAAVRIEVVAHQWWWRIRYLDAAGAVDFESANELRIPTGGTVELVLRSADVIHSLWVPALAGKVDMLPGHTNRLRVSASREGVFRGQCAEYCGGPHALMAFFVVAHNPAEFERWREAQRAPGAEPREEARAGRGRALFMQHCSACHAVRGTDARGELGPDLTHVGSRLSLGAGVLAMNAANAAAWVRSSQHIKPGNLMPSMDVFADDELEAIAAYLVSLR